MLGIAADMSELCPDAWLLNYTNPMAMLCWATYEASPQTRIVGLCHSVQNTTRQLAEAAGVPYDEVTYLGAGINHQSWILRFERAGEDLYPLLDAAIDRDPELLRRVRVEIYRRFGRFPGGRLLPGEADVARGEAAELPPDRSSAPRRRQQSSEAGVARCAELSAVGGCVYHQRVSRSWRTSPSSSATPSRCRRPARSCPRRSRTATRSRSPTSGASPPRPIA